MAGRPHGSRASGRAPGTGAALPDFHSAGRTSRRCPPLGQPAQDPRGVYAERVLDVADRRPAGGANDEPLGVDLHADRAPLHSNEPIVDRFAREHDAAQRHRQRRPPASSIARGTRSSRCARAARPRFRSMSPLRWSSSARPSARNDGRTERDRHGPRPLAEEPFGHSQPALCATGTIGTPSSRASRAPPVLYLARVPTRMRVPSG